MTLVDLTGPLRAAIARSDPSWLNQPSYLRRRLEEELGPDARRQRAYIHQLVVAAEERVPIRLRSGGWSTSKRDDLVELLVTTRGWTAEASMWAVTTWAVALGLTNEVVAVVTAPGPALPPPSGTAFAVGPPGLPQSVLPPATEIISQDS